MERPLVLLVSLGMLSLALPVASATDADCDSAQARLVTAVEASPEVFTREIADVINEVMEICDSQETSAPAPGHYHARGPKVKGQALCAGTLVRSAMMDVIVVIPFVTSANYQTLGTITYTRTAGGAELMSGRDTQSTGFDAGAAGVLHFLGVAVAATHWDVEGRCSGSAPCQASGFAAHSSAIYILIGAEIGSC